MTVNQNKYRELTIEKALELASEINPKTRENLSKAIGEDMINTLCKLGFITQGATLDGEGKRVAVWNFTGKKNPFEELRKPYTEKELALAEALLNIGY